MITTVIITLDILSMTLLHVHTIVYAIKYVDNFYFEKFSFFGIMHMQIIRNSINDALRSIFNI